MKNILLAVCCFVVSIFLLGCGSPVADNSLIGAAGGGILGNVIGGDSQGTLIGAGIGLAIGIIQGINQENKINEH